MSDIPQKDYFEKHYSVLNMNLIRKDIDILERIK